MLVILYGEIAPNKRSLFISLRERTTSEKQDESVTEAKQRPAEPRWRRKPKIPKFMLTHNNAMASTIYIQWSQKAARAQWSSSAANWQTINFQPKNAATCSTPHNLRSDRHHPRTQWVLVRSIYISSIMVRFASQSNNIAICSKVYKYVYTNVVHLVLSLIKGKISHPKVVWKMSFFVW